MRRFFLPILLLLCCAAAVAQSNLPEVAPGLRIPDGSGALPLALDRFNGVQELVPIHHSTIELNNHTGANIAGGLLFQKQKKTIELPGLHARVALHDPRPSFFVHVLEDPDSADESAYSDPSQWALVPAAPKNDHRVLSTMKFSQITEHAKRAEGQVETEFKLLGGGWVKITPKAPLAPGEYALTPLPRAANTFATVVFDFSMNPAAPNAPDAISAKP
jgi:hypothetical protein